MSKHPLQPVAADDNGVARFKDNQIVRFLLDAGPFDLNQLALMPWSDEDRCQLAQLLGYSVSGYGELSYTEVPLSLVLGAEGLLAVLEKAVESFRDHAGHIRWSGNACEGCQTITAINTAIAKVCKS